MSISTLPLRGTTRQVPDFIQAGDKDVALADFISHFRSGLLHQIGQSTPVQYQGPNRSRDQVMDGLKRTPFPKQRERVQAMATHLLDFNSPFAVLNAEMGTGKTMMSICLAAVLEAEGIRRHLVLSPPHLVYKWRREILDTIPGARVWVLNGPDCIAKLLAFREALKSKRRVVGEVDPPEFFIMGRVRMRMGFHWRVAATSRKELVRQESTDGTGKVHVHQFTKVVAACPDCGSIVRDEEKHSVGYDSFMSLQRKATCTSCKARLWTLMRPGGKQANPDDSVRKALLELPTIGPKRADALLRMFGAKFLGSMLEDNIYEFTNLLDEDGDFVFTQRQSERMERALSKMEFSLNGGAPYQPTEFVKRYLPKGSFGSLIVDEGHEYKASNSAQAQAFGVLASQIKKVILLTGTLMGGYADDLFYLLMRGMPSTMIADGFRFNAQGSMATAAMAFMQRYGVLKTVYRDKQGEGDDFKTAKGSKKTVNVSRAPGFSPAAIARYLLPHTAFLKLKEIGGNVLPAYQEDLVEVEMDFAMRAKYTEMQNKLVDALREALRRGDRSLLGVVANALLRWPETCFESEIIKHPQSRDTLMVLPSMFGEDEVTPKEEALIELVRTERAKGRKTLIYTAYSDSRDTTTRLRRILKDAGFNAAVLKANVPTHKREDWIAEKVDSGIDCLICNPELVKTGLDLLEFPTIAFMSTGFSTFTVLQAARRSWRIGQKEDVRVVFFGYTDSAQTRCLKLMSKKIQVSQSTAGEMPETGLSDLDEDDGDSIEMALAKELVGT
ncbi:DEAD/DEAH box helicase [Denitratimonas sp. CY0512]|uniref:DEAD/DEAH box helicase n=1 Tax=Denitratimonas sp. CY0512 TaxID=3131940 RepID=UPI0030B5659B